MSELDKFNVPAPETPPTAEDYGFIVDEEKNAYSQGLEMGRLRGIQLAVDSMIEAHKQEVDAHTAYQQDLEHRLTHDTMIPELWNKQAFEQILGERLTHEIPTGVLFCDFDNFKDINDTYGHQLGDEIITAFGSRMAQQLRTVNQYQPGHEDVVSHDRHEVNEMDDMFSEGSRFGGDEFSLLFYTGGRTNHDPTPTEEHDAGWVVAERVVGLFHDAKRAVEDKYRIKLNTDISVGMVVARRGETAQELLKRADKAMYQVKHSKPGRE